MLGATKTATPAQRTRRLFLMPASFPGQLQPRRFPPASASGHAPHCASGVRDSPRLGFGAARCQDSAMGPAVSRLSHHTRLALLAIWAAAFGFGLLSLLIAQSHPGATFGGTSWAAGLAGLAAGWAAVGAGFYVWWRRGEGGRAVLSARV